MPSTPATPAFLSEACCQWGHQLGMPWGPPTPPCRTFKLNGPGVQLPWTAERQTPALYVHIAVETQVPVILSWIQPGLGRRQGLETDSALPTQAKSTSSVASPEPPGSKPRGIHT